MGQDAGDPQAVVFRIHAIQRMFERGISVDDVRFALRFGVTVEDYPEDTPYPSRLVLGWREGRPLHVVVADDRQRHRAIVVTVYEPDQSRWDSSFRWRRQ